MPVLVKVIKELLAKNEALKNKDEKIEVRLEKLEVLLFKSTNIFSVSEDKNNFLIFFVSNLKSK